MQASDPRSVTVPTLVTFQHIHNVGCTYSMLKSSWNPNSVGIKSHDTRKMGKRIQRSHMTSFSTQAWGRG